MRNILGTWVYDAKDFFSQGTPAFAVMSIAAANANRQIKEFLQGEALKMSRTTGETLQIPGAVDLARAERRKPARRHAANDNGHHQTRSRRAA